MPNTEAQPQYDLRYLVNAQCNLGCIMCLNEGVPILQPRGGIVGPTANEPIDRAINVFKSMVNVIGPENIRNFNLTGGEPTLEGVDKVSTFTSFLRHSGIQHWWLNSNAVLLTPKFVQALSDSGLTEVKVHLPTMNPDRYRYVMQRNVALLQKQIEGIEACIEAGWKTDINVPLMSGVNDNAKELERYLHFSRLQKTDDQVTVKIFQLERGQYGTNLDDDVWTKHHITTDTLKNRLTLTSKGSDDNGRMQVYKARFANETMRLVIIDDISPQTIPGYITQRRSFAITHDLKLTRMWEKPFFEFNFSNGASTLDQQWKNALKVADRN